MSAHINTIVPTWLGASGLTATRELIGKHAAGKSVKVAVTEWNATAGDWGPGREAVDLGKCPGLFPIPQSIASSGRSGRDRQSIEPGEQFLLGHHPDR